MTFRAPPCINDQIKTNTIETCTMLQNDLYSIESSALFSSDKLNEQIDDNKCNNILTTQIMARIS